MKVAKCHTNSYERSLMTEQEANVFLRMKSKLSNTLMSCLPQSRVEAVDAAYVNAPQYVTALINRFSSKLQGIHNSGEKGGCWYSPYERGLFMDEGMNHAEYTDVIKHEMGHFIDHMMGSPSGSLAFLAAMKQDRRSFDTSSADDYRKNTTFFRTLQSSVFSAMTTTIRKKSENRCSHVVKRDEAALARAAPVSAWESSTKTISDASSFLDKLDGIFVEYSTKITTSGIILPRRWYAWGSPFA